MRALVPILLLALACRATAIEVPTVPDPSETICGEPSREACDTWRFMDVPVFWLNVDSSTKQADRLRMHLKAHLAPGVCAHRVSAVLAAEAYDVMHGEMVPHFANTTEEAHGPVDMAITMSHLKAAYMAQLYYPDRPVLVLEDDVDWSPAIYWHHIGKLNGPGERSPLDSLLALQDSVGMPWDLIQLQSVTRYWNRFLDKAPGLDFVSPSHWFTPHAWGATAYLTSPNYRRLLASWWPVTHAPQLHAGIRFRVDVACTLRPRWPVPSGCKSMPRFQIEKPVFLPDHCVVQSGWFTPPLGLSAFKRGEECLHDYARANDSFPLVKHFAATPFWANGDCREDAGGVHAGGSASEFHEKSTTMAFRWWEKYCEYKKCTPYQERLAKRLRWGQVEGFIYPPTADAAAGQFVPEPIQGHINPTAYLGRACLLPPRLTPMDVELCNATLHARH